MEKDTNFFTRVIEAYYSIEIEINYDSVNYTIKKILHLDNTNAKKSFDLSREIFEQIGNKEEEIIKFIQDELNIKQLDVNLLSINKYKLSINYKSNTKEDTVLSSISRNGKLLLTNNELLLLEYPNNAVNNNISQIINLDKEKQVLEFLEANKPIRK
jgi:hypothetical protein